MFLIRWLTAIVILPGTVLVAIPGVILSLTDGRHWTESLADLSTLKFWAGMIFACAGLVLALWTTALFFRRGKGTAAPWDPPREFVVDGPYRHVRNPMITGVFMLLLAESLILQSWPIFVWLLVFLTANLIYIPAIEEKQLAQRFPADYLLYTRHVPRWIPRFTAWENENPPSAIHPGR